MVKYKVNLKFKDTSKSLNEITTEVLKIELQKRLNTTCNYLDRDLPCNHTHYLQEERNSKGVFFIFIHKINWVNI